MCPPPLTPIMISVILYFHFPFLSTHKHLDITENSPFKPGSPYNQFIMPADKGKFSVSYTSQRGCYYLANQKVELFERDAISQDDLLNSTMTTFEGKFYLTGSESWDSDVQFYLKASHNCLLSQEQVDRVGIEHFRLRRMSPSLW